MWKTHTRIIKSGRCVARGYKCTTCPEPFSVIKIICKIKSKMQKALSIRIFFLLFLMPIMAVVTNTPK